MDSFLGLPLWFWAGVGVGSTPYIFTDAVVVVILWPFRHFISIVSTPRAREKAKAFLEDE